MTQATLDKLKYAFMLGCSDNEACFYAEINPATLYNYQDKNPEFLEKKKLFKENPIFIARESVVGGLKNDHNLALKFLEKKKRDEFGPEPSDGETEVKLYIEGFRFVSRKNYDQDNNSDDSTGN